MTEYNEKVPEMTDAAREARRLYKRAWNQANKDKVKAAQTRYWIKKSNEAAAEENKK